MSLPRFYTRVADAIGPIAALDPSALAEHLGTTVVAVHAPPSASDDAAGREAALLAVNLAARLYPRLHLSGPTTWTHAAAALATAINPNVHADVAATVSCAADVVTLDWVGKTPKSPSAATPPTGPDWPPWF
jgi:hypothetical protein